MKTINVETIISGLNRIFSFPSTGCLNGGEGHVNTRGEETCVCSSEFKGDHCEISKLSQCIVCAHKQRHTVSRMITQI